MKRSLTRICTLLLLFLVAACASDDKPEPVNYPIETHIVGKWYLMGYDTAGGYVEYNRLCEEKKDYLEFLENGRSTEQNFNEDCEAAHAINASWTVNNVYLNMDNDEDEVGRHYTVVMLNGNDLILEQQIQTSLGGTIKTAFHYSK